ncbi:MAG: hypothetical protein ABEI80_10355 [Haloplanus sp.]
MQRRAAAIYVAFFIVLGATSYSIIATASAPSVEFDNPDYRLSQGDQFSVNNRQYTVSKISAEMSGGGGGHGGGATVTRSGQLTWTNDSARYTTTWKHDATVTYQGETYRVLVAQGDDPTSFRLQEAINRSAILREDPNVRDETVTVNGTEYVVSTGNETTLTPASEYFPEPSSTQYAEGDRLQYQGNATTVASVSSDGVTLAWTAPRTNTIEVSNEANVTLHGTSYFAYFPDNSTLVLEDDYGVYAQQTAEIDTYHSHVNGLWGVSIVSFATAIMLLGMAYLPSRY